MCVCVYVYIYVYIYILTLRFEKEIACPVVENEGKFTPPKSFYSTDSIFSQ